MTLRPASDMTPSRPAVGGWRRLCLAPLLACLAGSLPAAQWVIPGGDAAALEAALQDAAPGDTVLLDPGTFTVNLRVDRPLVLEGRPGAVLDGDRRGRVVTIAAPEVTLRGLEIRRSGIDLTAMDAGVFVERAGAGARILDNTLARSLFGIWVDGAPGVLVRGNRIQGEPELRSQDRGNGIHLFNTRDSRVEGNEIWEARDGIYIDNSADCILERNRIHHLRYGIHYMYSHDNTVRDNLTWETRTGYALMQSRSLTVTGNRSEGDTNYGILMNFITYSEIAGNRVQSVARGQAYITGGSDVPGAEGKGIFIYNSLYNEIRNNRFADGDIGIHLTAGSEDNHLYGNDFVNNRVQVKYVASREQEWSHEGHGNFWSDYLGWDLDADGVGDRHYEPNDAVDKLLWKYPLARLLMNSPAVQALRWVQREFPVFRSPGVRDSHPLMMPAGLPEH
ncbi:nitrous oxidase accessory protein [Thioalbus denitrificans]|uniref:Nitrous oxidase accessory protein n=2 Tax=Thioalbus denitrificans TaxID=547122 RepID=A0A369CE47_9GAMM|nr:nitrous oxidase accessory protein [Thioalbus denitrificans]